MPSKWLRDHRKKEHEEHKQRIREMKSLIDTKPPREMPMSRRNEIERERRRALIEQDNRILLDRLAIAMESKNLDNVLVKKPFISLMELQRKKELKKIMIANSRLLDRIQSTVPSYDHVVWEKEAEHHVEILRNMTEFPELFVAPGTHEKGRDMRVVDEERAKEREAARAAAKMGGQHQRSGSASPQKGRPGTRQGTAKSQQSRGSSHSPSGKAREEFGSPVSFTSGGSGFVPYSYFPEEQYAQYQRNLALQQLQQQQQYALQQQMQLQMQMQAQGGVGPYPYGASSSGVGGYMASPQLGLGATAFAHSSSTLSAGGNGPGPVPMLMTPDQQQLFAYHLHNQQVQQRQPFQQQQQQQQQGQNLYYGMQPSTMPPLQQSPPPPQQQPQQQPQSPMQGQSGVTLPDIYQGGNRGY